MKGRQQHFLITGTGIFCCMLMAAMVGTASADPLSNTAGLDCTSESGVFYCFCIVSTPDNKNCPSWMDSDPPHLEMHWHDKTQCWSDDPSVSGQTLCIKTNSSIPIYDVKCDPANDYGGISEIVEWGDIEFVKTKDQVAAFPECYRPLPPPTAAPIVVVNAGNDSGNDNYGLSGGAIACIAIVSAVLFGGAVAIYVMLLQTNKASSAARTKTANKHAVVDVEQAAPSQAPPLNDHVKKTTIKPHGTKTVEIHEPAEPVAVVETEPVTVFAELVAEPVILPLEALTPISPAVWTHQWPQPAQ